MWLFVYGFIITCVHSEVISCGTGGTNCKNGVECSGTEDCIVECPSNHACEGTIKCPDYFDCNITATAIYSAQYYDIICPINGACNILCEGTTSCRDKSVHGGNGTYSPINLRCLGSAACQSMNVYGSESSALTVAGCTDKMNCKNIEVYCPPKEDGNKRCSIQGISVHSQIYKTYSFSLIIKKVISWRTPSFMR